MMRMAVALAAGVALMAVSDELKLHIYTRILLWVVLALLLINMRMIEGLIKYRHIPGPMPLPCVGNLFSAFPKINEYYRKCEAKYGGCFKWFLGTDVVIVLADLDLVRGVALKQFSTFTNHADIPEVFAEFFPKDYANINEESIILAKDTHWKGLRSIAASIFHNVDTISGFCPLIEEKVGNLVDVLKDKKEVEIWRALGSLTLDVIGSAILGIEFNAIQNAENNNVVKAVEIMLREGGFQMSNIYLLLAWLFPFLMHPLRQFSKAFPTKAMTELECATKLIISTAKQSLKAKNGHKNFMTLFNDAKSKETGRPLTEEEVIAQAYIFLVAGYETTANTLAFAVYLICAHEQVEEKLMEEIKRNEGLKMDHENLKQYKYTLAILKEVLRLYGPASLTDRQAKSDVMVGKYKIFQGTMVHFSMEGLHHNEKHFKNPEIFDPLRFYNEAKDPKAWTPFGVGPRMCVGYQFALEEAMIALILLHKNFKFTLKPGYKFETTFEQTLRPKNGIQVLVQSRQA